MTHHDRFPCALVLIGLLLCPAASAQEEPRSEPKAASRASSPGPTSERRRAIAVADSEIFYVIEMKLLEGRGVQESISRRKAAARTRDAENDSRALPNPPADIPPERTAARPSPAPRILPSPPLVHRRDIWDELSTEPGVTVLAAPKLMVIPNQEAAVQIQTQQIFTYLEALGEGKYQVKHTPVHELGMTFMLVAEPTEGDAKSVDLSSLEFQVTTLDGREAVEGLDLDVGKPIISTRSLKTAIKVKFGDIHVVAIPSGPKTEVVLAMRVTRMESQAESIGDGGAAGELE